LASLKGIDHEYVGKDVGTFFIDFLHVTVVPTLIIYI